MKPTAAEVRPAEDLAEVAAAAKREHEATRAAASASLSHAIACGEQLAKVHQRLKEEHRWLRWLKQQTGIPQTTASAYLIVYENRVKLATVAYLGFRGALEWLRTGKTGEEEEPKPPHATPTSDMIEAFTARMLGQTLYIRQELGGMRNLLADRDKVDWEQLTRGTLPKLRELHDELGTYIQEIEHAAEQDDEV